MRTGRLTVKPEIEAVSQELTFFMASPSRKDGIRIPDLER
jgi:hypothetical protein